VLIQHRKPNVRYGSVDFGQPGSSKMWIEQSDDDLHFLATILLLEKLSLSALASS